MDHLSLSSTMSGGTSFLSKVFGLGRGKYPLFPSPILDDLLPFPGKINCGICAGWKLYENLFDCKLSFLLTGTIEFIEPTGFKGFERNFL